MTALSIAAANVLKDNSQKSIYNSVANMITIGVMVLNNVDICTVKYHSRPEEQQNPPH